MSGWNHQVCEGCYQVREPGRQPITVPPEEREPTRCCLCGNPTASGIFYRMDPKEATCGGKCP